MKTCWIDLATAAEILGVTIEGAESILGRASIRPQHSERTEHTFSAWAKPKYDAQAVEELAKIREAGKP